MIQEPNYSQSSRPAEAEESTSKGSASKEEGGFAATRTHAVLAFLATRRWWPRLFGYGMLIIACRVVRTIIRA